VLEAHLWFIQCQKSMLVGVLASTIPAVTGKLVGTKQHMRPGRNILSPVTGWIAASFTCRARHISSSLTPAGSAPSCNTTGAHRSASVACVAAGILRVKGWLPVSACCMNGEVRSRVGGDKSDKTSHRRPGPKRR
jgi:hypothetical protein